MVNSPVLVLNQNYEPLNICRVRRAIILLFRGKAEVLENGRGNLHSIDGVFDIPSVIRLGYFIKRPRQQRKLTKLEVFNRDHHIVTDSTCLFSTSVFVPSGRSTYLSELGSLSAGYHLPVLFASLLGQEVILRYFLFLILPLLFLLSDY